MDLSLFFNVIFLQNLIHEANANTRNFAAHGSHELKINDVEKDKVIVYDDTDVKDVQNFKNLLYEFLNFFA